VRLYPENALDERMRAALAQSIEREPHYVQANELNGVKLSNIGERHRYVGAHAQVLRRHFPGPLPFGALVAFPLPEYVMVHEIGMEQHLVLALKTVQDVAARFAGDGDKPITAQVYWWRPGQYETMAERDALFSGRVPDLRPVGVQVEQDGERLQVGLVGDHTAELVQGWEAARG
jgi:hypothetical protein